MSDTVIRVENLSKQYRIGRASKRHDTLRDQVTEALSSIMRRNVYRTSDNSTIWALKNVSFEVKQGEVLGIIGANGAGKSTLLKILSRITEPTSGIAQISGRVRCLLEVGTGFHPELNGRENIYLNGAILGMLKSEIDRKFDEIVAFAEVEKFIDTPVKHYSSGMYVRLAFAVAAHLDPEILIVDEVLAVGDASFQKKCLRKMEDASGHGRTVLFVSHNMAAIGRLCPKALLFEKGNLVFSGDCGEAIQQYLGKSLSAEGNLDLTRRRAESALIRITDAYLQRNGTRTDSVLFGDNDVKLIINICISQPVSFSVECVLRDNQRIPIAFSPSGLARNCEFDGQPGEATVVCKLPALSLAEGEYTLDLMLAKTGVKFFDYLESALSFNVLPSSIGGKMWTFRQSSGQGCFLWEVAYELCPSSSAEKNGCLVNVLRS